MEPAGRMVRFVGLSRSGNHAVIDWVLRKLTGRWRFYNCVEPKADPVASARPMDDGRTMIGGGRAPGRGPAPDDWVLFSQEDTFLGPALGPKAHAAHEAAFGRREAGWDIIIVRDPFNLIASRRRLSSVTISEAQTLRIWSQHARAAISGRTPSRRPALGISYGHWVRDSAYRTRLCLRMGLSAAEAGLDRTARCGGGSSFDGLALDGRARDMAVFDRWRHCKDDPGFWRLFDPATLALCRALQPSKPIEEAFARWAAAHAYDPPDMEAA